MSKRFTLSSGNIRLSVWGNIALAFLAALASQPVRAQVLFGSMVGNVTDPSGAAVPAATVKITETNTGDSRMVQTNDDGLYNVSTVPAGTYQVEITKEGF